MSVYASVREEIYVSDNMTDMLLIIYRMAFKKRNHNHRRARIEIKPVIATLHHSSAALSLLARSDRVVGNLRQRG